MLTIVLLLACAGFVALGVWQVQRLHWKHDLIARVDARVAASPVALPSDRVLAADDFEYLRVRAAGRFEPEAAALVRAATGLGTGYWTMVPMRAEDGRQIWINRGFVPAGTTVGEASAAVPTGLVMVTGLLRKPEPGGSLLQSNRPADDRWYSRDVAALAQDRGIGAVVPAFIDAQAEAGGANSGEGAQPVPGLTVINFPDNHLSYALTWFALAVLSLVAIWLLWRVSPNR
ncbi:SURF1-like protein [Croceicoccus mobilis]|uniref:SURF1-like protein n=1 Tax=Croceicoccus mobilis TaxID=1703339 RepID=A0A916YVV1_9SPHN|nr:SURF1-like protein [Croceicoccus mobilis]